MSCPKSAKDWRKHVGRDGRAGCDAERAAFEAAELSQLALGYALNAEKFATSRMEESAGIGEPDRPAGTVDELEVELSLQFVQGLRDGWLAQMQRPGRFRESALIDDGSEQSQVVQVDRHYSNSSIDKNNVLESWKSASHCSRMEATPPEFEGSVVWTLRSRLTKLFPGIGAAIAVAAVAIAVGRGEEIIFGRAIIEPLVLAILVGMLVRAMQPSSTRQDAGVRFVAKDVLEIAVCLLGATMDVPRLFAGGPALALGITVVVVAALSAGYAFSRIVGLSPNLATLVACGNAICGNSAIAAVAPVIGADREDVAASIALTAVLGVVAVLGLPALMPLLGYTNYQYGVLAGLTVYAVPQVLAASFAVSVLSGQVATVVKLARVLMLGPVVLFFSMRRKTTDDRSTHPRRGGLVPWFVIGFIVLATLRSFAVLPDAGADAAKLVASWLTIAAMAALGLASDLRAVRRVGTRVMLAVAGSLAALFVMAVSLIEVLHLR